MEFMKEQKKYDSFDITLLLKESESGSEQKYVLESMNDREEQSTELKSAYRKALNAEDKSGDDR